MNKELILSILILFAFPGCDLVDKAQNEFERIEDKYNEYVGEETRGERPFTVVFQEDETKKTTLIPPQCNDTQVVKHIYFTTPTEASNNIFTAIKDLNSYPSKNIFKPFWDLRYTNPVNVYINQTNATDYPNHAILTGLDARSGSQNITVGSSLSQLDTFGVVNQSKCVNGVLTAGTTLNLHDAPEQTITYAGLASTFGYNIAIDNHIKPWNGSQKGNLMIQAYFDTPIYHNFSENDGGSVAFNVFLHNPKIEKNLNFVIGLYAYGEAWQTEKAGIRYDPTTNIIHVATVAKDSAWWATKSPESQKITEVRNIPNKTTQDDGKWPHFFRVNLSYQNLLAVLNEMRNNTPTEVAGQDFGLSPEDWEVTFVAVQYELEEKGGKASISGSFSGFQAYLSEDPL